MLSPPPSNILKHTHTFIKTPWYLLWANQRTEKWQMSSLLIPHSDKQRIPPLWPSARIHSKRTHVWPGQFPSVFLCSDLWVKAATIKRALQGRLTGNTLWRHMNASLCESVDCVWIVMTKLSSLSEKKWMLRISDKWLLLDEVPCYGICS